MDDPVFVKLDPQSDFDNINLSNYGYEIGDTVQITLQGGYCYAFSCPEQVANTWVSYDGNVVLYGVGTVEITLVSSTFVGVDNRDTPLYDNSDPDGDYGIVFAPLDSGAPEAADDFLSGFVTTKDEAFTTGSVLENDTDPDDDELFVEGFDVSGTKGLVSFSSDGTFYYDPNGQFGELGPGDFAFDTFTYTVSDGVLTDTATVTITVTGASCEDLREQRAELQTQEEIAEIQIQGLQEQIAYLDEGIGWAATAGVWATLPAAGGAVIGAVGGVLGAVGALGLIAVDVYYAEEWDDILISTGEQVDGITDAMADDIASGRASGGTQKLLGGAMKTIGKVGSELGTILDIADVYELAEEFQFRKESLSAELSDWEEELTFIQEDIEEIEGFLASCPDELTSPAELLDAGTQVDHFHFDLA